MHNDALRGQVILVVDDDTLRMCDIRDALEEAGAHVAQSSVQDAPALVEQGNLSVVMLDCHPASGERRALIRCLRQHDVPFLFYSVEPPADVTTERGAPFIGKPCPPEKMVAAVRYLLRQL